MTFTVGITRDVRNADGTITYADKGLTVLDQAGIEWRFVANDAAEISAEDASGFDALLVFAPRVTKQSLSLAAGLAVVARVGVGVDNVDLVACREAGVAVTNTPEAIRRPMGSAAMALILALTHKLKAKDSLVREGRWQGRFDHVGVGLTGRVLGLIGFGTIGQEIARLAQPFGLDVIAHTPRLTAEAAAAAGVRAGDLETVLAEADVLCLACPLTPETHHLLNAERLDLMKKSAFVVNVARGAVVDQAALTEAVAAGRIAGAGLDVFETEPISPNDPILALDNVIVAPHALGHVDHLFIDGYRTACENIAAVAKGQPPPNLVDPLTLDNPLFQEKLARRRTLDAG